MKHYLYDKEQCTISICENSRQLGQLNTGIKKNYEVLHFSAITKYNDIATSMKIKSQRRF